MHEFRAFPTVHVCPPEQFSLEGSFLEEQRLQPKGGKAMSAVPMRRPPFLWGKLGALFICSFSVWFM